MSASEKSAEAFPAAVNAGARLDRLPISRFHYRLAGLIGAGLFLDGFEIYLAGGVISILVKSGWTDLASGASFVSAGVFGMMLGAWLSGILGDLYGRRFSYQLNLLIFGLASFASATAPSMPYLIAARFVMGIGLGAEIVVGYATLVEYIPPSHRGRWGAGLSIFTNCALFVSALSGYFILPTIGWRWLFVGVGVAAMFVWYLRKGVPESPRWLESRGRNAEAEQIVSSIERESGVTSRPTDLPAAPTERGGRFVFSREMIARFAVGIILNIGGNAAVYGFFVWLPSFFVKQGLTVTQSLGFTTVMSLGGPIGAAIGMYVADRFNRKSIIVAMSLLSAIVGMIYPYADSSVLILLIGFILVSAVYVFVAVGWACYIPELFPTEVRLRAAGVCNAIGRLVAASLPFVVVPIFSSYGIMGVSSLLGSILVLQAMVVATLGINTNRRSLEELQPDGAQFCGLPASTQLQPK
jgi:MFS transporter, putative metabolite:H+ symporter